MDDRDREIASLRMQLALRDLRIRDLESTVDDLAGRNQNPEFNALRAELADMRVASTDTNRAFLAEVNALEAGMGALRLELVAVRAACEFDIEAKNLELAAMREAMGLGLVSPISTFEVRANGHVAVYLTRAAQEETISPPLPS